MPISHKLLRSAVATAVLSSLAIPALAHHGFGLFQLDIAKEWSGTLTKMNLVNPHSYMELDVVDENGKTLHMRCEMRAATVLRRSGWSPDMFVPGVRIRITGNPHRDDPASNRFDNDFVQKAPGGENLQDVTDRAWPVIVDLEQSTVGDVLIVSHITTMRCILGRLLGLSENTICSLQIPNAVPVIVERGGDYHLLEGLDLPEA